MPRKTTSTGFTLRCSPLVNASHKVHFVTTHYHACMVDQLPVSGSLRTEFSGAESSSYSRKARKVMFHFLIDDVYVFTTVNLIKNS